ncbi:MAG: wyosine [tRNA(Phe)-imidazoG37] synthetase (radical SAM superfamily) [Planctomycetota bacterium]|jgi:wyosine [tRNA(Phe)-imidazoG37] synthetase (radical SAM superfamily)
MTGNTQDHPRDSAGLTYVYPVVSRRARGVSVGLNLNPNNACNWRCVYCQVEELQRGSAPDLDLELFSSELEGFLDQVVDGDWMQRFAPLEARRLNDLAFSGNGEPTTSAGFGAAVELAADSMDRRGLTAAGVKLVLITNGSMLHKESVQHGLARMARSNGELWYKLDAGREEERLLVNDVRLPNTRVEQNLRSCASLVATRIQTCFFARGGLPPSEEHLQAYLDFLERQVAEGVALQDVMLYGLARPSQQSEAPELSRLPDQWLAQMAERVRALGLEASAYGAAGAIRPN